MYSIGVDLGGTKLLVAAVDSKGMVQEKRLVPTDVKGGAEEIRQQIVHAIYEIIEEKKEKPKACGVGLAGQIDAKSGLVFSAPNLKWQNVPFKAMLEHDLGFSVAITNDVRAATWAEWRYGAAKGCTDCVCIFVGTGIGGGIVSNNQMVDGATNSAAEIGHMVIHLDGRVCHCGQKGCFEAYAGGWAIAEQAAMRFHDAKMTTKEVAIKYKEGDSVAKKLIEEVVVALVIGSVNVVNCLNPKRLIFGGGVMKGMPELLPLIHEGIKRHALKAATKELEVVLSALGPDAGVVGASVFANNS